MTNRPRTALLASVGVGVGVIATVVWMLTRGYFWPRWVWFALVVVGAITLAERQVRRRPAGPRRWLALDGAVLVLLTPIETVIWSMTGGGFFWPLYSLVAFSIGFGVHVWLVARRPDPRERELTERVDTLTRTRRGALDSQAAELRRIERDLHDGAQARLVSLALNLGLAGELMDRDPERAGRMVEQARRTALTALDEVRSVAQTIHPAVLADRGLADAVRALAYDLAVPVEIVGVPPARLDPAVESALYFAIAECLANVVKHSGADSATVTYSQVEGVLHLIVTDDGTGGADDTGGTGLRGIRRRLAAFDGTLSVSSPPGGPTRVAIVVPLA